MSKKKGKRQGVLIPLSTPEYSVPFSEVCREDSTHVLICQGCGMRRYTDARFAQTIDEVMSKMREEQIPIEILAPRHRNCGSIMRIERLDSSQEKGLTQEGE